MNKIVLFISVVGTALLLLGGWSELSKQSTQTGNLSASIPIAPINGKWVATKVEDLVKTVTIQLTYQGSDSWYISPNNPISQYLTFQFKSDSAQEFTIKIIDRENPNRFSLPYQKPFPFTKSSDSGPMPNEYAFNHSKVGEEFYFTVYRAGATNEILYDTRLQNFMFSDKFMEISTSVNNNYIFGLGERRQSFRFKTGSYSFWNKDAPTHNENGKPDGQLYGTHPMWLKKETSGNFHIGFLRNAGGMLAEYVESERLTFRLISGIIEFQFFLGDNQPETVVQKYHAYINGFSLHPFWSQGFHQCRWGYKTSGDLLQVWNQYNQNNLPFDVLWSDIDYMQNLWDFTIDTNRFKVADMQKFSNLQDQLGVHWVPIIDAGVAIAHESGDRGKQLDVFIKSSQYPGTDLMGCVWPGKVHYPDFNHPNASQFWTEGLQNISAHYNVVPSGIWIDMNEFSNFQQGEIPAAGSCDNGVQQSLPMGKAFLDQMDEINGRPTVHLGSVEVPYNPTGSNHPLDQKTMSLDAFHYCGTDSPLIQCADKRKLYEFDYHNLNGFGEGIATNIALKEMGNPLPFIITRSSLFGSGAYVQHWTGDNDATWTDLYLSISEIFNFGLFGIPFVGADICGFAGETTPELCARWMQLGALYPFARNHNVEGAKSQEPYAFPNYPYVLESSRKSLQLRYSLLRFYYSQFVYNNGTGTVFRPLFFEFPHDDNLYSIDWEFMIGESLMAAPVLIQSYSGADYTHILVTFPTAETFFDYYTGKAYSSAPPTYFDVPFTSSIPLFLRAGTIVATQDVSTVSRSRDLSNQFNLKLGLERETGSFYVADGFIMSISDYSEQNVVNQCTGFANCIVLIDAQVTISGTGIDVVLTFNGQTQNTNFQSIVIDSVEIYGYEDFTGSYSNDIKQFYIYKDNVITKSGQQISLQVNV